MNPPKPPNFPQNQKLQDYEQQPQLQPQQPPLMLPPLQMQQEFPNANEMHQEFPKANQTQGAFPKANQMQGNNQNKYNNDEDSESEVEEDDEQLRTIFCGNLDERVTEELLYEIFINAGPIKKVTIPKQYDGRQRSFGFITYTHQCAVPYALDMYRGLSLYDKFVYLQAQGSSNHAPNNGEQPKRYSLPNNEGQGRRTGAGGAYPRRSFDNAALRGFNGDNVMPAGAFDFSQGVKPFKNKDAVPDQTRRHRGDDRRPDKRHSGDDRRSDKCHSGDDRRPDKRYSGDDRRPDKRHSGGRY